MISISVIGAGQVGKKFCKAINAAENLHLEQWYNRSKIKPRIGLSNVHFCYDLMELKPVDLYIIAVSDSAVETISNALPFENRLVVHTSGSVALRYLNKKNRKDVKNVAIDFIYNINSKSFRLNNPKINNSQSLELEEFLDDFNSKEDRVFNKITFKNFINSFFKVYAG